MKSIILTVFLTALSYQSIAEEMWYFAKVEGNEFIYSNIIGCDTPQNSEANFSSSDAVGPFSDLQMAQSARNQEVDQAIQTGKSAKHFSVECD